jgi:hypothetical protein
MRLQGRLACLAWYGSRWGALTVCCWAALAASANAQPRMYTDRAAWEADAAPGIGDAIGFDSPPPPQRGYITYDTSDGANYGGVNFVGVSPGNTRFPNYLRVVHHEYASAFDWGSGSIVHGPPVRPGPLGEGGHNSHVRATLPPNVRAVGSDYMSYLNFESPFIVLVSTAAGTFHYNVGSLSHPNRAFVGFISPIPIGSIVFAATNGFPILDNFAYGPGPDAPGRPKNLTASVLGSTVRLTWLPPDDGGPPLGYQIEAALSRAAPASIVHTTTATVLEVPNVPDGTYYVRIRAFNSVAQSVFTSNVVPVTVGAGPPPCSGPPQAPTNLEAFADGTGVSISWSAPGGGCSPTSYSLLAGHQSGVMNLGQFPVGLVTSIHRDVPPGRYYVTVVARNAFGVSPPSNEVLVVVTGAVCSLPQQPASFSAASVGGNVMLAWTPPTFGDPPTSYLLEVGSRSGLSDIGTATFQVLGYSQHAPNGTYYLRVRARNACGVGPPSVERVVVVTSP